MIFLRILLLPISVLYGLAMQLRNLLYDLHFLKTYSSNKPVISVGNISAGGTGKTPFTIYLASMFLRRGKKVAVISRGYGRRSKGYSLISDGKNHNGDTARHGDEPVLISLCVPEAIVAVCENRRLAIEQLNTQYDADLFILDDGFQHRAVERVVDIVLLKDKKSFKNKIPLPAGLLREFLFNFARADFIINRDEDSKSETAFRCVNRLADLHDMDFKNNGSVESLSEQSCVAFAGIADPLSFKKSLEACNIRIIEFIAYKDHYLYNMTDVQFLIRKCLEFKCKLLLCTQKDLVKIREIEGLKSLLKNNGLTLYAPALNVILDNDESFWKKIESHLDWFDKR
jgi:tetraacyldisaccharide 4'-kinase